MIKKIKRVVVGASVYKVIHTAESIVADREECYGAHDYEMKMIRVTDLCQVSNQLKEETLVHEICHAIEDDRRLGLDETQLAGMSAGIYQVLRDNKKLFKAFTFGK